MDNQHFLIVTSAGQGHINPALHLAKLLSLSGARATFVTTVSAHRRILSTSPNRNHHHPLLSYAAISDGYDNGFDRSTGDPTHYMSQFKLIGSRDLSDLARSLELNGRPITCIIYSVVLHWAADIARDLGIPSFLLWIQSATVFSIFHHYLNGYRDLIDSAAADDPSFIVELPGLPPLGIRDLPSFLQQHNPVFLSTFKDLFGTLEREAKFGGGAKLRVLVNSFEALEGDAFSLIDGIEMVGIGPLVRDPSDADSRGDLLERDGKDYKGWLDAKAGKSVVYVSFGTLVVLPKKQMEEMHKGLVESGRNFLWVVRRAQKDVESDDVQMMAAVGDDGDERGMVVEWCSQVEVLSHPSIGCFVTHCGWNSMVEGLVSGVPMVGLPQYSDQTTNAKMVEDVWGTGVRGRVNGEGVVVGEEIVRCLEVVMGEEGVGMRRRAGEWKENALEAIKEGGSSHCKLVTLKGCS